MLQLNVFLDKKNLHPRLHLKDKNLDILENVKSPFNKRKRGYKHSDPDECCVCNDGGYILLCDSCNKDYHKECHNPKVLVEPKGEWNCFLRQLKKYFCCNLEFHMET